GTCNEIYDCKIFFEPPNRIKINIFSNTIVKNININVFKILKIILISNKDIKINCSKLFTFILVIFYFSNIFFFLELCYVGVPSDGGSNPESCISIDRSDGDGDGDGDRSDNNDDGDRSNDDSDTSDDGNGDRSDFNDDGDRSDDGNGDRSDFNDDDDDDDDGVDRSDDGDGDADSDASVEDDNFRRKIGLIEWAISRKVPHVTLDALLVVLRRDWPGGDSLPKSSKTLLGTLGARYNIRPMADLNGLMGQYTYCGIQRGLEQCIEPDAHATNDISLQFHCDGLSVSKSSRSDIWPILCKVYSKSAKYEPFVVAMFHGQSKPRNVNEYLEDFVNEINELLADGLVISGRHFNVHIQCIIADTPARAFLKSISGHTGVHACERCTALGQSSASSNNEGEEEGSQRMRRKPAATTVFPNVEEMKRTDESFRTFRDHQHHKGPSLLTSIVPHINMILCFVLDFMHLGFLGIMAKFLEYWFSLSSRFRVGQQHKTEISRRLEQIKGQIPREFQRKIRAINNVSNYKAVEYKFFAFYAGPIVLKNIIPENQYNHFILFHHASRLLWSERTARQSVNQANVLLEMFFERSKQIYGNLSATINMHNLIHVADDVVHTGLSLSEINAFAFENYLGIIKRQLRSPYHLLAQICRRNYERVINLNTKAKRVVETEILEADGNIISKLRYQEKYFTTSRPNNMILLKNEFIVEIQQIYEENGRILIQGQRWMTKGPIYHTNECDSTDQHIYELNDNPVPLLITFPINRIDNKL
ncbi:hypothetical protein HCN44_009917, partial [Aphidius gifuensis]